MSAEENTEKTIAFTPGLEVKRHPKYEGAIVLENDNGILKLQLTNGEIDYQDSRSWEPVSSEELKDRNSLTVLQELKDRCIAEIKAEAPKSWEVVIETLALQDELMHPYADFYDDLLDPAHEVSISLYTLLLTFKALDDMIEDLEMDRCNQS